MLTISWPISDWRQNSDLGRVVTISWPMCWLSLDQYADCLLTNMLTVSWPIGDLEFPNCWLLPQSENADLTDKRPRISKLLTSLTIWEPLTCQIADYKLADQRPTFLQISDLCHKLSTDFYTIIQLVSTTWPTGIKRRKTYIAWPGVVLPLVWMK